MTDSPAIEENFEDWIGKTESCSEQIHSATMAAMAATLDLDSPPTTGDPLPAGWQWLFFNPTVKQSGLGDDGHPAKGGFLPPVPLPRRMWAGSRIRYLADLPIDKEATKTSKILNVVNKSGKRGKLCFVTVEHTTSYDDHTCIIEAQDIVYKEATPVGTPAPTPKPYEETATWSRLVEPDTTMLFRFSALTFNGHRIHYDLPYARDVEAYPDLVVHGPLTATLLQGFATDLRKSKKMTGFDFRGITPLFVDRPFNLEARDGKDGSLDLWARGPDSELAMSANAYFE